MLKDNARYLIKVEYECPQLSKNEKWFIMESAIKPEVGRTDRVLLNTDHGCKRYKSAKECYELSPYDCYAQIITDVRSYSEKEARELRAIKLKR